MVSLDVEVEVEGNGGAALTEGDSEVSLVSGSGLDVIREVVGGVAREVLAAGDGTESLVGPHLLDVVGVVRLDDGRDVEVGQAVPATEDDLSEHTLMGVGALRNGNEVTDEGLRHGDDGLLSVADSDRGNAELVLVAGEEDGTGLVVQSPEGESGSLGDGGRAEDGEEGGSKLHFDSGFA